MLTHCYNVKKFLSLQQCFSLVLALLFLLFIVIFCILHCHNVHCNNIVFAVVWFSDVNIDKVSSIDWYCFQIHPKTCQIHINIYHRTCQFVTSGQKPMGCTKLVLISIWCTVLWWANGIDCIFLQFAQEGHVVIYFLEIHMVTYSVQAKTCQYTQKNTITHNYTQYI